MECTSLIVAALKKGDISESLCKGSSEKKLIIELQMTLFELGFRKELKWDKYQADGDYGKATAAAVAAFAQKNKQASDGNSVSNKLAEVMIQRHSFLPSLYILWTMHNADLRTKKYISTSSKTGITAIQVLLSEMGYGDLLKLPEAGADGQYNDNIKNTIIAYAKNNGIESDGDLLTRPLINLMLKDINVFYGSNWSDQAENNLPGKKSPLVYFEGTRFRGKPCRADVEFVPMLEKINDYAQQAGVYIHVTSSFRRDANVQGAIVTPAKKSNHMAGHSIDMNLIYGNGKWANSVEMGKYPNVDAPVKQFLDAVINDSELRWGGQFQTKDAVHIDDGLNQKDPAKWDERYKAMQKALLED